MELPRDGQLIFGVIFVRLGISGFQGEVCSLLSAKLRKQHVRGLM